MCRKTIIIVAGAMVTMAAVMATSATAQTVVTHGPIVGAVTEHSARILVRLSSADTVHIELDTDSTFSGSWFTDSAVTVSESDFFTIIDIPDLQPDTRYYYRPVIRETPQAGGAQPGGGSFITFPTPGEAAPFTFAFGACQQADGDPNSGLGRVFPLIAQDQPRFFLQLGDWTYPDTTDRSGNMDYFNVDFTRVQANYRSKYDPGYLMAELFKTTPIGYIYDDHDYANNNADMTIPGRQNSLRGYDEMFPHYPLANPDNGIWHKFTYGNAEFFMLDNRSQRHPNTAPFQQDAGGRYFYQPRSDHLILSGDPTISGQLQMDWLIQELKASTADWKFICTGVTFNPATRILLELALFLQGTPLELFASQFGFDSLAEVAMMIADGWNGFSKSVERLVGEVNKAGIENVIVLSGDSHTAGIDDGANSLFPEVMAGGLDRTNSRIVALEELFGINIWNRGGQTFARGNFNSHYGRITVFGRDSVRMELVDEFGELITGYTQESGILVSGVGLNHVTDKLDFGDVEVGSAETGTILLVNTGADTVFVSDISSSIPEFKTSWKSAAIPPGVRRDLIVSFEPASSGSFSAEIAVHSNDPQSPIVVSMRGNGTPVTAVGEDAGEQAANLPEHFVLQQNYPNPFNPTTTISFALPEPAKVSLTIHDLTGREVAVLIDEEKQPGEHEATFNAEGFASGIYFYAIKVRGEKSSFSAARKILLLK